MARTTGKAKRKLTSQEIDQFLADANDRSVSIPFQLHGWVHGATRATLGVADGNRDLVANYWIGVYGILHDLRRHLQDNLEGILRHLKHRPSATERVPELQQKLEAIAKIRSVFSDEEAVYIQFMRNVHSHPLQHAYGMDIAGGRLRERVNHTLISRELTITETNQIVADIVRRRFDPTKSGHVVECEIAQDFAVASREPMVGFAALWPEPNLFELSLRKWARS